MTLQTFLQFDGSILIGFFSLGAAFLFSLARLCFGLAQRKGRP